MSDYLPTHDHFYGYFSKERNKILYKLNSSINTQEYLSSLYRNVPRINNSHDGVSHNFEHDGHRAGTWDLKIEWKNKLGNINSKSLSYLIEYKTSLEESNIEQLIRQIKNRGIESPKHNVGYFARFILTYDERFEMYRDVIENENIVLCILPKDHIPEIKSQFCLENENANQSGLASYQEVDSE